MWHSADEEIAFVSNDLEPVFLRWTRHSLNLVYEEKQLNDNNVRIMEVPTTYHN